MTSAKVFLTTSLLCGALAACGQQASEPMPGPGAAETASETAATEDSAPTPVEAEGAIVPTDTPVELAAVTEDVESRSEDHDHDHEHGEGHDHEHSDGDDHTHDHEHDHEHDHDDDQTDGEHRHGGEAHMHGAAEFSLVLDADAVEAEFRSPLYNLVGFEHEPQTPEQEAAMEALTTKLQSASSVFTMTEDAGCETSAADIQIDRSGDHGSLTAIYTLRCDDRDAITEVTMSAFENFAALETVDLVVIGTTSQEAGTAKAEAPVFALGR